MSAFSWQPPASTLLGVLRANAAGKGDTPACWFVQAGLTRPIGHATLLREAARYARLMGDQGVAPGGVALIILRHSPDLIYAFWGAMMAGLVPSFMPPLTAKQDPAHYWDSHEALFERIGEGLLLTDQANAGAVARSLPRSPLRIVVADTAGLEPAAAMAEARPGAVAFLQHSSGTTGVKKGVALSHEAVLAQVQSYAGCLRLSPEDVIVSWLPLYHDMGLIACFLLPLMTGIPLVLLDPFEWVVRPALLLAAIREHRGTLCWLPNFAFNHLCRTVRPSPELDVSSMRAWIDCSEPCRPETFERFVETFGSIGVRREHLQVCYAMAETVFAVSQTEVGVPVRVVEAEGSRPRSLSAGRVIPGLAVQIRDEAGQPVPEGVVGEIAISGRCLFAGYHHLDAETRRKLREGWYHTEDLGFVKDGELFVSGRKNDLIIVHGRNYYAHDLEHVVNQVPGVHPGRCVALGWFKPEVGSEEVVVIAEPSSPQADGHGALVTAVKQALLDASGLLPYDVLVVPAGWLVKTTSGKLSRTDNLQKYLKARS